jgi:cytochrome c oxidase subunit 2
MRKCLTTFAALMAALVAAPSAFAQEAAGIAKPWGLTYQEAASQVFQEIQDFHNFYLMPVMVGISVFVIGLIIYVMIRYREKANPTPSKVTHNQALEVVWTAIPVLILVVLSVPSTRLLFKQQVTPADTTFTLKVTGFQWAWNYQYPGIKGADGEDIAFDAYLIGREDPSELTHPEWRLLETDNFVVLPTNTNIRIQVAARDVIHSFALPALGLKKDAMPGRLNETWTRIDKPGIYFGQCSEICGLDHGYMPIAIKAVPQEQFNAWVAASEVDAPANDVVATIQGLEPSAVTIDTAALTADALVSDQPATR